MKKVKVSKLDEVEGALHPFNKPIGTVRTGMLAHDIKVGGTVMVLKGMSGFFETSEIQRIHKNTDKMTIVETYNSIYKVEYE